MAASIGTRILKKGLNFSTTARFFYKHQTNASKFHQRNRNFTQKKRFFTSLISIATVSAAEVSSVDKPFEPNDARLRSSECLKNAAGLAVDSTSAVLSQTVYAIINIEKQYVELLDVLVRLREYQIQVLSQKSEVERIEDIILETRYEINEMKKRKQDLAILFASVEKLADATAEVAFATGSSFASTSAGERLHRAQQEVNRVLAASEEAEKQVAYIEADFISQLTKHEEKNNTLIEEVDDLDSEGIDSGYSENSLNEEEEEVENKL